MNSRPHLAQAAAAPVADAIERPTLLVVDDDRTLSSIISRIGDTAGFDAIVTKTVEQASAHIKIGKIDCVTLDLSPGCEQEGIQFLRLMEEIKCTVPVVIVSGASARQIELTSSIGRSLNVNICETLQKPLDTPTLRRTLTRIKDKLHR